MNRSLMEKVGSMLSGAGFIRENFKSKLGLKTKMYNKNQLYKNQ
jgi:hypothetical protein